MASCCARLAGSARQASSGAALKLPAPASQLVREVRELLWQLAKAMLSSALPAGSLEGLCGSA